MSKPPTCHYDAERGWLTPEHLRDCDDRECAGCRPCPKSHCDLLGRCPNHVEQAAGIFTCPSCIGKVKRTVRKIVDVYALVEVDTWVRGLDLGPLLEEAAESGIEGEAFNLIGPAADPDQYAEQRRRLGVHYQRQGWCDWPRHERFHPNDPHHPYAVLGRWDMAMRESYGPQTDLFVTVASAADYLTGPMLEKFAHTSEFEEFARDVATCLAHLESVLNDTREPEKGAPCRRCPRPGPRLVKRYAEHVEKAGELVHPTCSCDEVAHCRICAGHDDTWHCPANGEHWWSDADYRRTVDGDYVTHADVLPTRELSERIGVPVSTLRRWAGRTYLGTDEHGEAEYGEPRLKPSGRSKDGRRTYSVLAALRLAEERSRVSLDIETLAVSKSG
jgi:hypothetical protein